VVLAENCFPHTNSWASRIFSFWVLQPMLIPLCAYDLALVLSTTLCLPNLLQEINQILIICGRLFFLILIGIVPFFIKHISPATFQPHSAATVNVRILSRCTLSMPSISFFHLLTSVLVTPPSPSQSDSFSLNSRSTSWSWG